MNRYGIIFIFSLVQNLSFARTIHNFPHYVEINKGETVELSGFPRVKLIDTRVTYISSESNRIGKAEATLLIGEKIIVVPVGYENEDVIAGDVRLGVEVIADYEKAAVNDRFHVKKDARIRMARAGEPLMASGSHVYPLFVPWNNGSRTQGWLTVCYNIETLEKPGEVKLGRHHDGWDFGAWEGQQVRSVCRGTVVSADDFPELIEKNCLYNKNSAPVGGNPFLVKHPDLPLLYYYTHMSGLARSFRPGEIIEKGEVLGYASARGSSGGWYHLHFSMILIDEQVHVNPFPFLAEWYRETMPHDQDFLSDFEVYHFRAEGDAARSTDMKSEFEKGVLTGGVKPTGHFHNSLPGSVHVREAVSEAPYAGLNHAVFGQFAVLKSEFNLREAAQGELWFGHTGRASLYLNGEKVYEGSPDNAYHRSKQPFQPDAQMIPCQFVKGINQVFVTIEQTDVWWQFSIRPRDRLGMPLELRP